MKLFNWLGNLLFPEKCVLCGRILQDEELDLCRTCRMQVPEHPVCRTKLPFIHSWTALWLYQDNVRRSILRFKFYGRRNYADAYARLLGMKLLREGEPTAQLITWVPISEKRRKNEGMTSAACWRRACPGSCRSLRCLPCVRSEIIRPNPASWVTPSEGPMCWVHILHCLPRI